MLKLFMDCRSIKIENSKTEFHIYIYIIRNEIEAGDLCGSSHKAMLIKLTHSIGCVNKCNECVSLHRSCRRMAENAMSNALNIKLIFSMHTENREQSEVK